MLRGGCAITRAIIVGAFAVGAGCAAGQTITPANSAAELPGVSVPQAPSLGVSQTPSVSVPAPTVIASTDKDTAKFFQGLIGTPMFRAYTNEDVVGVELCGALKNIDRSGLKNRSVRIAWPRWPESPKRWILR